MPEKKNKAKDKAGETDQTRQESPQPEVHEVNTDFMKEEIRQRPVNRKRLARRTAITVLLAVLFGVVACVVFILLEPVINSALNPSEEPADVSFEEETVIEVEEEMSPEDMIADDQEIQAAAAEEIAANSVESITQEVLEEVQGQLEQEVQKQIEEGNASSSEETDGTAVYEAIAASISEVMNAAQSSMVTVNAITSDYDWVGDAFDETNSVSGLLIADRGTDLLILADSENLEGAQELRVTFHDGQTVSARVLCTDPLTGLAVLSANPDEMEQSPEDNEDIAVCSLGSSVQEELTGALVIAVGSPTGTQGSVNYGIVTDSDIALDVTDSAFRQITTNIYGSTQATGVLFDSSGEVIGWIDMDYSSSDSPNLISAIGISELKGLIENMSNEFDMGYLGVHGTDVPESVREEQGIPEGVYVLRTELDSPAMDAGIQAGDVITSISRYTVTSCDDLTAILEELPAGRTVSVTVERPVKDGYETVRLTVKLAQRLDFAE